MVFTGMLELMKTDDMLAAILGHEMAHAIMGHMVRKFVDIYELDLSGETNKNGQTGRHTVSPAIVCFCRRRMRAGNSLSTFSR